MSNQPVDYQQRQLCLDEGRSFSVRAPAGSGKTELLTQRVLKLLTKVQKPEEILCITFTRKAAAEMLDRILEGLKQAKTPPTDLSEHKLQSWTLASQVLQRDQELSWKLLQNPSRLRILTIDGLCARLTKALPTQSQFGSQPEIAQDPHPLYQLAVHRLLAQLEDKDDIASALSQLLTHLDNRVDVMEQLLIAMLARRDQWLSFIGTGGSVRDARLILEQGLKRLLQDELQQLTDQLLPYCSSFLAMADYAASNLQLEPKGTAIESCLGLVSLPENQRSALNQWRGLSELVLKKDGDWRQKVDKRSGFIAGTSKAEKEIAKQKKAEFYDLIEQLQAVPGLKERLQRVQILPADHYQDSQWQMLEALTLLLPNLVAQLLLVFAERGAVDYPQVTSAALTALGDDEFPTDLSLLLDYQIQHILVDEFQDTSSPQIQLLEKLTYGWQPGDGRTLFIVGDGMQSCYGFRDANVGLFLEARKHGIGQVSMTAADLSVNFRSQSGVVEWVNQIFAQAFPAEDDISRGAVSYENSNAFNPPLADPAVSVDVFLDFPDRQAEAQRILELVNQAWQQDPQQSVAILVRNRNHLKEILPCLRQAGLRWQATDLDSLASRMWVVDMVSLLRARLNPADRIAWLAILRAPWCGLGNADLLAVAGKEGLEHCIWSRLQQYQQLPLSADGQQRVARLVAILNQCWQQRRRKPLRLEIESCWLALGGPATLNSQSQRQDIDQLLQLIESHDCGGALKDDCQFQRDLEKLFAAPDSDGDPRLQVMTIHKSKGLEFETVILAGLDRAPRADEKRLLMWQQRLTCDGKQDLLLGPLAATGEDQDPLYQYLKQEQQLKNQMEGTRLLYVGATRAIKRLHLVSHLNCDSKGKPRAPSQQALLSAIWPYVKEQATLHQCEEDLTMETESRKLTSIRRLPGHFQLPELDQSSPLSAPPSFNSETEGPNLPEQNWQELPRHIGTLTHRILQQMVLNPELMCDPLRFEQFKPGWHSQLRQMGVTPQEANQAVSQIDQLLRNVLEDSRGRWIINQDHQHSACELELTYFNGFQAQQMVVDRTFVDDQGNRWIIDYKTAMAHGDSFSQFVSEEVERYKPQLTGYARAFLAMENRPIRAALYFPDSGHFEEVDLDV
ncbi:MAG: UvrD-helicase domain-containing protein [Motiliproteus sp.]|nr:UvrD-helicase domain-containing protein [Motiliproteus sp.]MCW9052971.1 UvrD-helicase domain-containing protein [Motiliproteus sp.]